MFHYFKNDSIFLHSYFTTTYFCFKISLFGKSLKISSPFFFISDFNTTVMCNLPFALMENSWHRFCKWVFCQKYVHNIYYSFITIWNFILFCRWSSNQFWGYWSSGQFLHFAWLNNIPMIRVSLCVIGQWARDKTIYFNQIASYWIM